MAYEKDRNYQKEMDEAAGGGDYKLAAQLESARNAKIDGEGLGYEKSNLYAGWLDDTDYSARLKGQMGAGAPALTVQDTLNQRTNKASGTVGLDQYAYDDVYKMAAEYVKNGGPGEASYKNLVQPEYASGWQSVIDQLTREVLGGKPFSYNAENDPLYQQYKKTYTREGERATQDAIGQVSARTGGLASSYAATAGTQAGNYFAGQLADKIPELERLAYEKFLDEESRKRSNVDMLMGLEQSDYNKYLGQLGQFNADRNFGFDEHWAGVEHANGIETTLYNRGQNALALEREDEREGYNRGQDALAREDKLAATDYNQKLEKAQTLAAAGDFSGYQAVGFTDAEIASMKKAYEQEMNRLRASGYSGGGGSSAGKATEETVDPSVLDLYMGMRQSEVPYVYLASNASKFGIDKSGFEKIMEEYATWTEGLNSAMNNEEFEAFMNSFGRKESNMSQESVVDIAEKMYRNGTLTEAQANTLVEVFERRERKGTAYGN